MDEPTKRRLASSTRFDDVRELAEVDSTNRYLMDLARAGAREGVVVVADFQSAGRGRRGRTWEAPPGGALLASILLRPGAGEGSPERARLSPERRWLAPAAVALAAADACAACLAGVAAGAAGGAGAADEAGTAGVAAEGAGVAGGADAAGTAGAVAGGVVPAIKWPNDLLLGDAKLAGILAEADAGAIVVGIGINVAWAPAGAASLGPAVDRGRLLATLLENLERWCGHWDEVALAYRRRCATVGRQVRVETPAGAVVGRAEAVEADGRLRVLVAAGAAAGAGEAQAAAGTAAAASASADAQAAAAAAAAAEVSAGELRWFGAGDVVHLRADGGSPP